MITPQLTIGLHEEIFIDNFAGGGGASTGIELALRRPVDDALNHCRKALAMHRMNHPQTKHHREDIRHADPLKIAGNRPVGGIWFSPDCKHHSKARGGKPRDKKIRGLAWSVVHWVNVLRARPVGGPRVIYLENVEEFQDWGPLGPDDKPLADWRGWFFRCFTGALFRRGFTDLEWAPGDGFVYRRTWAGIERVPDLAWSARACDHGAPTIRRRLYLIARSDGRPVIWPAPTHAAPGSAAVKARKAKRYRITAECVDFSLPCPSIFMTREDARAFKKATGIQIQRPLAKATLARIAKGVDRFVLRAKKPFIVNLTHQGEGEWPVQSLEAPLKTLTAANRGEKALVTPSLAPFITEHANASNQRNFPADEPSRTQCAEVKGGHFALAAVHLTKFHSGATGASMDGQAPTVTANSFVKRPGGAAPLGMVAASVVKMRGDNTGHGADEPVHVISAQGNHHGVIAAYLAQHNGGQKGHQTYGHPVEKPASTLTGKCAQQQIVGASLVPYYGSEEDSVSVNDPARTVTCRDRFAVTQSIGAPQPLTPDQEAGARRVAAFLREHGVQFDGDFATVGEYVIVDLGMRMLKPRELYLLQGFPKNFIIDKGLDEDERTGRLFEIELTGTEQVRMCGNSVSPPMAEALVAANNPEMRVQEAAA